jgi:L-threonylcarbamoyladenylate synthase
MNMIPKRWINDRFSKHPYADMDILPPTPQAIATALVVLRSGGIVAHATETCYGLACDLTNPDAVAHLFAVKQRPLHQPVSALFPSIEATDAWVLWTLEARALAERELPGPLTIILPLLEEKQSMIFPCPSAEKGAGEETAQRTLGIRISPHSIAMGLAREYGEPLSTTSANLHGRENPYSIEEIRNQYADGIPMPDLAIDSGELPKRPPSRILDYANATGTVLRR